MKSLFRKLSCMAAAAVLGAALCVTASAAEGDVAINAQNFPDANFRNVVSTRFDTNKDGVLSQVEIANVTSIGFLTQNKTTREYDIYNYDDEEEENLRIRGDWHAGNIADFTGLQYFTELKYLYAAYEELTSIDVTQNAKLEVLELSYYGAEDIPCGSGITSLDVTHNPNLRKLYCAGSMSYEDNEQRGGKLTSLDVSQNPKLEVLDCSGNQLTSLDVSQNASLKELSCGDNQLTKLDVSHNALLEILGCSNNPLTNLDVTNNPALVQLFVYDAKIKSLDVTHNAKLRYLQCSGNQLTKLDVSHNPELYSLKCYDNNLRRLDLSKNTQLYDYHGVWCDTGVTVVQPVGQTIVIGYAQ